MDNLNDDDLFLDAVDSIVLEALAAIGPDSCVRCAFFRRLLAVAHEPTVSRHFRTPDKVQ